jgi:Kef-type K+ transport system membrane component KefB
MRSNAQHPTRATRLVRVSVVAVAHFFGLDAILGAIAAGGLVSLTPEGEKDEMLRQKLEAIGFGLFIPIFFTIT